MPASLPGSDGLAERYFWSGHASPASVWSMTAALPVMILAVYRRDRPLLVGTVVVALSTPLLASPPTDDRAWATRVVLGERAWLDRGLLSSPADLLLVCVGAPVILFAFHSAARRRPIRTVVGTVLAMLLVILFFDRMVALYEARSAPT